MVMSKLVAFFHLKLFTMPPKLLNCPSTGVVLDPGLSNQRRDDFLNFKLKAFKDCTGAHKCHDGIPVDLDSFLAMLQEFAIKDNPKKYHYNAMRVYFGAYPRTGSGGHVPSGKNGFPTLLFVPTTGDDYQNPTDGTDDVSKFYYIDENGVCRPDTDHNAHIWIGNFQRDYPPILRADGNAHLPTTNFNDTLALLYAMGSIGGIIGGDPGLIDLILCGRLDPDNPIIDLEIKFACFIKGEPNSRFDYPYQTTLIFGLIQADDSELYTFGSGNYVTGLVDADTGIPCPPNGSCPTPP